MTKLKPPKAHYRTPERCARVSSSRKSARATFRTRLCAPPLLLSPWKREVKRTGIQLFRASAATLGLSGPRCRDGRRVASPVSGRDQLAQGSHQALAREQSRAAFRDIRGNDGVRTSKGQGRTSMRQMANAWHPLDKSSYLQLHAKSGNHGWAVGLFHRSRAPRSWRTDPAAPARRSPIRARLRCLNT